jgi:hypothetical protein
MIAATCETCPFWQLTPAAPGEMRATPAGVCHHALSGAILDADLHRFADWWCSEHPLRQRDQLAAMAMQGLLAHGLDSITSTVEKAHVIANEMINERRRKIEWHDQVVRAEKEILLKIGVPPEEIVGSSFVSATHAVIRGSNRKGEP